MIDDVMHIIRIKIGQNRNNNRAICNGSHIDDTPVSTVAAD